MKILAISTKLEPEILMLMYLEGDFFFFFSKVLTVRQLTWERIISGNTIYKANVIKCHRIF